MKVARTPTAATRRVIDASATRVLAEVIANLDSDERRPLDYYRPRELCPPLSRSTVRRLLADGTLEAVKLGGTVLVTGKSIRNWLATAKPWNPR